MSDQRLQERTAALELAIAQALGAIPAGPTLSAFGIARDDCALVHIDYFSLVADAGSILAQALADHQGIGTEAVYHKYAPPVPPCDCESCVGKEKAEAARQRHREAYTNVKEWVPAKTTEETG